MRGLALLLCLAASLSAQQVSPTSDIDSQVQAARRQKDLEEQARKEALEARKREVSGTEPDVAYEQVMADPDNIDLNFLYARSQVKRGNLRGADGTLERILLINPNLPKVRLLYVVVLLRLDNLDEAQKQIDILRKEQMAESLRAELDGYDKIIRRARAQTHYSGSVGMGVDFDDNKNAASATGQALASGLPITLDSNSTRKTDFARTYLGSLNVARDLGYQAGHQVFGGLNYYRSDQTNVRTLNIQSYSGTVGATYRAPWVNITPTFEFNHLLLAQTTYLRSRLTRLQFDREITARFDVSAQSAYTRLVYNNTAVVPNGVGYTGDKIEGGLTVGYALTPSMRLHAGFTHSNTGALFPFFAYRRESLTLSDSWAFGRGQFILINATFNYDRYLQPELDLTPIIRHDDTYRARGTYGLPLELISKPLSHILWTFSYEYYQALSNIPNYAYSNNKISTMLTYQFGY